MMNMIQNKKNILVSEKLERNIMLCLKIYKSEILLISILMIEIKENNFLNHI